MRHFLLPAVMLPAVVVASPASPVRAQIWTANAGVNSWSVGSNWSGGTPPTPDAATTLVFAGSGSQQYTANNDMGPFSLGTLQLNSTSSLRQTIGGNELQFAGGSITGSGSGDFLIDTPISGGFTYSRTGGTTEISGVISGAGSLTKSGTGILALSGFNSFSGGVTVNDGTLRVLAGSLADGSGAVTVNTGGSLEIHIGAQTIGALAGSGGTVHLNGTTLTIETGGNTTYAGTISGTGSLVKTGSGQQSILNTSGSSFTGPTSVIAGTLQIARIADGGLPSSIGTGDLVLGGLVSGNPSAGTLHLLDPNPASTARNITLDGLGGTIITAGTGLTLGGVISGDGTGGLTYNGNGVLVLSGTNTFSGPMTVRQGTLEFGLLTDAGSASSVGTNGTIRAGVNAASVSTLRYTGPTASVNRSVDFSGLLLFDVTGSGSALTLSGSFAPTTSPGTAVQLTKMGVGALSLANGLTTQALGVNGGTLLLAGNVAVGGATTVNQATLSLSGTYSTTGGITVNSGGALSITGDANLGAAGNALTLNGGTLRITGSGTVTADRAITLGTGGGTFDIADAGMTHTFTQALTGNNGLTKSGPGTLAFSSANAYTGAIQINGGVLRLNAGGVATNGQAVTIGPAGTLEAQGTLIRSFNGSGTIRATGFLLLGQSGSPVGYSFPGTLEVAGNSVGLQSAGRAVLGTQTDISDGGYLSSFNGVLLGGGLNGTTVDPTKVLTLHNGLGRVQGAFTNNGSVQAVFGSQLEFQNLVDGAGSFSGLVAFLGGWSPGNSAAAVTVGNVTLGAANTLTMELGGATPGSGHDTITINGVINLGGTLSVTTINGFAPAAGDRFDLFEGAMAGTFSNVVLPGLGPGLVWDVSELYSAGVISVLPVPEPTFAVAALAAATAAVSAARRFLRSRR